MLRLLRSIPQLLAYELEKRVNRITLSQHRPEPSDDNGPPICIRCSLSTSPPTTVRWPCPPVQERLDRITP